jgi:hypothetical protein
MPFSIIPDMFYLFELQSLWKRRLYSVYVFIDKNHKVDKKSYSERSTISIIIQPVACNVQPSSLHAGAYGALIIIHDAMFPKIT